jgi:esterase/lipase
VFFNETSAPYQGFELIHRENIEGPRRCILLSHGLSDSPYYLKDMAAFFYQNGFDVFVPLMKAHGNEYAKFETVRESEWMAQAEGMLGQLLKNYDLVSVGGFSNGAVIAARLTLIPEFKKRIQSLYLFSPAFKLPFATMIVGRLGGLAEALKKYITWSAVQALSQRFLSLKLVKNNCEGCRGQVRYNDIPLNAVHQVQLSGDKLSRRLKTESIEVPTFMALTSDDTAINISKVKKQFIQNFSGPKQLLWIQGKDSKVKPDGISKDEIIVVQSDLPISHSGLLLKESQLAKPSEVDGHFDQLESALKGTIKNRFEALFK